MTTTLIPNLMSGDPGSVPLRWAMVQREEASLMFQARGSLAEKAVQA